MVKDDIFLEWFTLISLCDSMFGAKDLLFIIEEKEIIKIKVKKKMQKYVLMYVMKK